MYDVRRAYPFAPSADAKRAARQKLHAALGKRRQGASTSSFLKVISRPAVWATAAVVILAIVGTLVVRPLFSPQTLISDPEGNFAFVVSDEPNAIGDFETLNITISKVVLQTVGLAKSLEFTPEVKTVDLTLLQGKQSQEIWRGDVPAGQYSHISIEVSEVKGRLESTGQVVDVRLPSHKLQMPVSFEVTTDTLTSFTFDITVVKTGNNGKYNLRPQIAESGAGKDQMPAE